MVFESVAINPAILYWGTPVVLISTVNEDGTHNIAPMSSAWWLGQRCMLGVGAQSKTAINIMRTGECVLNLPSDQQVDVINKLSGLTGVDPVPEAKLKKGYRYEKNKFGVSGLTPLPSDFVKAMRVAECPVQMEGVLSSKHKVMADLPKMKDALWCFEIRVARVHVHENIISKEGINKIDSDKWRPLIMSFQNFYGLTAKRLAPSELSRIPEELYRYADIHNEN